MLLLLGGRRPTIRRTILSAAGSRALTIGQCSSTRPTERHLHNQFARHHHPPPRLPRAERTQQGAV
eukprot:7288130-Prymnesium_polylepis.1